MSEVEMIEKVTAVLCLAHMVVNVLWAWEAVKIAAVFGTKWECSVDFTTIAAFVLSIAVVVRWIF